VRLAPLVPAVILAAVAALPAVAQPPPPTFGVRAELVTVDVVVLGPDGRPVPGLTRDDFVVKEDGRPQTISRFEMVEVVVPGLEAPTTVSSPSLARVATNVSSSPTRRTFAIVFDDLHVNDLDIEQAKRAVETFVARDVRPGDRLVLFTTSDGRYWATMRGGADDPFKQALRQIRSHEQKADPFRPFPMMHYEAMRIEEAGDEHVQALVHRRLGVCQTPSAAAPAPRRGRTGQSAEQTGGQDEPPIRHCLEAAEAYTLERGRLAGTLRIVREVMRSLAQTAGRKSLVLVTTGFPVDPTLNVFREVRDHAARANVALTYLDARGLPTAPLFSRRSGG
jgi:VWFA-related protein